MKVIALDGHDGAGKTTLALALAERIGACYVRPFGGLAGTELLQACNDNEFRRVLHIGATALETALSKNSSSSAVVLDRSWLTVSTLVPEKLFSENWSLWIPTVLLWSDIDVTVARLNLRLNEEPESIEYHQKYLALYLERRELRPGPLLRTDLLDKYLCLEKLIELLEKI